MNTWVLTLCGAPSLSAVRTFDPVRLGQVAASQWAFTWSLWLLGLTLTCARSRCDCGLIPLPQTCTCLCSCEQRSSEKLHPSGSAVRASLSPSPQGAKVIVVGVTTASSVSGLVEKDVAGLGVLGDVRREPVELLNGLSIDLLQERRTELDCPAPHCPLMDILNGLFACCHNMKTFKEKCCESSD